MLLKEELIKVSKSFPAEFKEQRDGSLILKFVIAERKAFLSKKKLTYKSKVRVNDEKKEVTFFEMLSESNSGLSAGSGFDYKKIREVLKEEAQKTGFFSVKLIEKLV